MVTAARTVSQLGTHMGIAFALMYLLTGSVAFGGVAAMIEPVCNVALLPVHQHAWARVQQHMMTRAARYWALALEKLSQTGMHMAVAFAVMYGLTGSLAFGGLAAILEPICNVVLMPLHDRLWEGVRQRAGGRYAVVGA